jgi:hypothetical protein
MFGLSIRISIPNLDRREIDIPCPRCRLRTTATLGDVRVGGFIICRGCKANLNLRDRLGAYHSFRRQFERMFSQLAR